MSRIAAAAIALGVLATPALAQEVGEVGVDWLGNDIIVEAFKDPEVDGVTCHVSYFERGMIDRLQKGNWFEDPSDSSIACRQTGPITIGIGIACRAAGERKTIDALMAEADAAVYEAKKSGRNRVCAGQSGRHGAVA